MAADTSVSHTSDTAILGRLIRPDDAGLSPAAAEALLGIHFDRRDLDRMHELAVKNQENLLSPQEKGEMENYRRVGFLLDLMHSKARLSLNRHQATR